MTATAQAKRKRKPAQDKYLFKKGNQFAKGHGRPRKNRDLVAMCRVHDTECVAGLIKIVRDGNAENSDKITAINTLLSYAHGKPKASVDVTQTFDITGQYLEALKAVNQKGHRSIANSQDRLPPTDIEDAEIVDSGS